MPTEPVKKTPKNAPAATSATAAKCVYALVGPDAYLQTERLAEDGGKYGITGRPFEPSRWLADREEVTVGNLTLEARFAALPHADEVAAMRIDNE